MAPARTGKDSKRSTAVISTDHTNKGIESREVDEDRIFKIVVMKLIAPKIDETPAKCKLKIARSTENPEWNRLPANGGYTVHPVPAPIPANAELESKVKEGGNNQNLMLFIRGNAIS